MLDTIIPMSSDAFWGIIAFLGVINFFAGNGGPDSMTFAMPLLLSSGTYYGVSRYYSYGRISAFIGAVVILLVTFNLLAKRIKTSEENKKKY